MKADLDKFLGPDFKFDHVGIAVHSIADGSSFWQAMGWRPHAHTEVVSTEKVKVSMLELTNQARIELLEPTDAASPLFKFLEKRGPGIHHICLRVKGLDDLLVTLKSKGVRLVHEKAVPGAHGCRVAFVHPSATGGVLLELSEKTSEGEDSV